MHGLEASCHVLILVHFDRPPCIRLHCVEISLSSLICFLTAQMLMLKMRMDGLHYTMPAPR